MALHKNIEWAESGSKLFQIAYWSDINIASADIVQSLQDILFISRTNNAKLDITGSLMVSKGHFAQILEGAKSSVTTIFNNIKRDSRHRNIITIHEKYIQARDFPEWSMAFVRMAPQPDLILGPPTPNASEASLSRQGAALSAMLRYLVRENANSMDENHRTF